MFSSAGFQTCNCGLCCADAFGNFRLCDSSGCTRFQKLVQESKFLVKSVIFGLYICAFERAGFKFFVCEHF